jgi:hypothetical protein
MQCIGLVYRPKTVNQTVPMIDLVAWRQAHPPEMSKQYIKRATEAMAALGKEAKLAADLVDTVPAKSRGGPKPKEGVKQKGIADAAGISLSTLSAASDTSRRRKKRWRH